MKRGVLFSLLALLVFPGTVHADTSTWNPKPIDGVWRHAENWTPAKVPNQYDTAVFGASDVTGLTISLKIVLEELVFAPGADDYTITLDPTGYLYFKTVGITNSSGRVQNFVLPATTTESLAAIQFFNNASAGSQSVFTLEGGPSTGRSGLMFFNDQSSAGDAVFVCKGATGPNFSYGGTINFLGSATAANATFMVEGGAGTGGGGGNLNIGGNFSLATAANANIIAEGNTAVDASGSQVNFLTQATAGSATVVANGGQAAVSFGGAVIDFVGASAGDAIFTINGALAEGAAGARLIFDQSALAAKATCIINGGTGNLAGGRLILQSTSTGDSARVEVFGNGSVDITSHGAPGVSIGSLEGDGSVLLGSNTLTVGPIT